jgi:hypothetical protein
MEVTSKISLNLSSIFTQSASANLKDNTVFS